MVPDKSIRGRLDSDRNQVGFTLIEMVLLIGIASALMIGVSRAVSTLSWRFNQMRNYQIALNLAKKQMAIMNNAAYPAVGTTNPASDASFPAFSFTQVVASVATSGADSIQSIEMRVSTTKDGQLVSLNTYRTNIVTFGNGS